MGFDEKDLNNNNNNEDILKEETNSISWEELLAAEKDVDLDNVIKNASKNESVLMSSNENISPEAAQNLPLNDVQEHIGEYVNNIQEDNDIVSFGSDGQAVEPIDDMDLLSEDIENISPKENIQDVVDDELLYLLDPNKDKKEESGKPDNKEGAASVDEDGSKTQNAEPEIQLYEPKEGSSSPETHSMQFYPNETNTKKAPILLIIPLIIVGVILIFLIMFFVNPANKDANSADLAINEESNYNAQSENNLDNDIQQAEELVEQVESLPKKNNDNKNKLVVFVPTGGRVNPFVPSALFDENGFMAVGADLSTPPDTNPNDPEAIKARKLFSIGVSGIMYDPSKPSAILKYDDMDYFVQAGDKIDSYIVKQITKDYVAIQNGANVYKAYVGEMFTQDEKISAKNQTLMMGNSRQYISSEDIQVSTK